MAPECNRLHTRQPSSWVDLGGGVRQRNIEAQPFPNSASPFGHSVAVASEQRCRVAVARAIPVVQALGPACNRLFNNQPSPLGVLDRWACLPRVEEKPVPSPVLIDASPRMHAVMTWGRLYLFNARGRNPQAVPKQLARGARCRDAMVNGCTETSPLPVVTMVGVKMISEMGPRSVWSVTSPLPVARAAVAVTLRLAREPLRVQQRFLEQQHCNQAERTSSSGCRGGHSAASSQNHTASAGVPRHVDIWCARRDAVGLRIIRVGATDVISVGPLSAPPTANFAGKLSQKDDH